MSDADTKLSKSPQDSSPLVLPSEDGLERTGRTRKIYGKRTDRKLWWIYWMMLWTLVPTLRHTLFFFGMVGMGFLDRVKIGTALANRIEKAVVAKNNLALFGLAGGVSLYQVAPVVLAFWFGLEFLPSLLPSWMHIDFAGVVMVIGDRPGASSLWIAEQVREW
jgi:hypothetical protein